MADLVHAMQQDTGLTLASLKADGGASRDHFLMQFQSDIIHCKVRRPAIRETTALGAAYLAGLAAGVWSGTGELRRLWRCDTAFSPAMPPEQRERLLEQWHRAVGRSRDSATKSTHLPFFPLSLPACHMGSGGVKSRGQDRRP